MLANTIMSALEFIKECQEKVFSGIGISADDARNLLNTPEENLKDLVSELGLTDRVIFTGQVDRSVVSQYRHALDIFVGPSRSEGLGHAFLSAMALRRNC